MKLAVHISEEVQIALKIRAAQQKVPMGVLAEEILRTALNLPEETKEGK